MCDAPPEDCTGRPAYRNASARNGPSAYEAAMEAARRARAKAAAGRKSSHRSSSKTSRRGR